MSSTSTILAKQHSKSAELFTRAKKVLPGGVSRNTIFKLPHPDYVEKGQGCYVTDIDGVTRIDFANNMASLIHGHANPDITQAIIEQVQKGTAFTMATEIEIEYAELLCARVPGFEKIRFVNSGTEAVMAMIKAARAFTGKEKIAKVEQEKLVQLAEVSKLKEKRIHDEQQARERLDRIYTEKAEQAEQRRLKEEELRRLKAEEERRLKEEEARRLQEEQRRLKDDEEKSRALYQQGKVSAESRQEIELGIESLIQAIPLADEHYKPWAEYRLAQLYIHNKELDKAQSYITNINVGEDDHLKSKINKLKKKLKKLIS